MTINELQQRFGNDGKQIGNRMVFVSRDKKTVHGFVIAMYTTDYEPQTVYNDMEKTAPTTEGMTWDMAHDALFGAPEQPRFGNNLINE